jgi:hypothetical protein
MVIPKPPVGSSNAPPAHDDPPGIAAQEACGRIGDITGEARR